MIQLTRLNNARLALNSDLIKYVEEAPDTVITLLSGEKLVVRETAREVIDLVSSFVAPFCVTSRIVLWAPAAPNPTIPMASPTRL